MPCPKNDNMYEFLVSRLFILKQDAIDWTNDHKSRIDEARPKLLERCIKYCGKGDCWAKLSDYSLWPPGQQLLEASPFGWVGLYIVGFECKCSDEIKHIGKSTLEKVKLHDMSESEKIPFDLKQVKL